MQLRGGFGRPASLKGNHETYTKTESEITARAAEGDPQEKGTSAKEGQSQITMRVGIHNAKGLPESELFARGFEALGWRVSYRNGDQYTEGQCEDFDAVVTDGIHRRRGDVITDYTSTGISALVLDFGYINRQDETRDGYRGVGLGGLHWIPPFACSAGRWNALGIDISAPHTGTVTVIAGQTLADPSHPFSDSAKMERWALEQASKCDGPVVFRPHPRSRDVSPKGIEIDTLPLAESLARAGKVITYTSNIGNDALLAGVEVEATGPAMYAGVTLDGREQYFHRLAYAQWTPDEIASGEAIQFVLDAHAGIMPELGNNVPDMGKPKRGRKPKVMA